MISNNKSPQNHRVSWDDYFIEIVDAVSKRATCDRGKSGCVIVKDNRILATGYVGAPTGAEDCYEAGHELEEYVNSKGEKKQHCIRTIHAEQNAIAQMSKYGVPSNEATLYCTMVPCLACAKLIVASGIVRVVAKFEYQSSDHTKKLFAKTNIQLKIINNHLNY